MIAKTKARNVADDSLLDYHAVSQAVGVTPQTIRRWWHNGAFPRPARVGGVCRWKRSVVSAWMSRVGSGE